MANHHSSKFGDHRHCGSEDIMFLVAEEENSRCPRFNPLLLFNPSLLFICKGHGLKAHGISYNSDPGHTRSKQQLDKTLKITFASCPEKVTRRKKRKKN